MTADPVVDLVSKYRKLWSDCAASDPHNEDEAAFNRLVDETSKRARKVALRIIKTTPTSPGGFVEKIGLILDLDLDDDLRPALVEKIQQALPLWATAQTGRAVAFAVGREAAP